MLQAQGNPLWEPLSYTVCNEKNQAQMRITLRRDESILGPVNFLQREGFEGLGKVCYATKNDVMSGNYDLH